MTQTAMIVSTSEDGSQADVLPVITGACMSCAENCAQRGRAFTVLNKHGFEIKQGALVTISASKSAEAVQSVISLLLPILCAIIGYKISDNLSISMFGRAATEGFKASCALFGIIVPTLIVFAVSRFKIRPARPYIEKVL